MDEEKLQQVINSTANLKAKEISLSKLADCLNAMGDYPMPPGEVSDSLWKISHQYCFVLVELAAKRFVQEQGNSSASKKAHELHIQANFLTTVDLVRQFTLHLYLPSNLRGLSKSETHLIAIVEEQERIRRLTHCVAQFRYLFQNKTMALHNMMGDCAIDFIAGYYCLSMQSVLSETESIALPKEVILRSLLMIKGAKDLTSDFSKIVHRDLLHLTGEPGGFSALCRVLLAVGESNESAPTLHQNEVIAKIVTSKGHTKKFYREVLTDCLQLYRTAICSDTRDAVVYANTCVECLKRFLQLPMAYRELQERIETYFVGRFQVLTSPEEFIAGYVVMEQTKLAADLYECHKAFTGSSISSLPSSVLMPCFPLFLKLYSLLPASSEEHNYLENMVIFCLANRTKPELQQTVLSTAMGYPSGAKGIFILHPRIIVKHNPTDRTYSLQMGPAVDEKKSEARNLLPVLVNMLKSANRNLLIYDVFVILLKELTTAATSGISSMDNVLLDGVEREDLLCKRVYQNYILVQSLGLLISHKHFHKQLYENPDEILNVLESTFAQLIDGPVDGENEISDDSNSDIVDVILSILQEFLRRNRNLEKVDKSINLLQRYSSSARCSDQTKIKIDYICNGSTADVDDQSDSACQNALSLCADQEPYCKVYGTTLLIKLLKDRDVETVSQGHTILILAFENLRCEESYAFLNSVRLLVALCDVLESETLDALLKEYLNEDNHLDYRLKIGEAIVKTVEALGPFAIRHRDELLNCFLAGVHNSVDEFRASNLSNIGSICRILSFQVHHFFYELFVRIGTIMKTDRYLPARRAAILVLSQLIEGMDGLMNFQEYLPLIYRFVKDVIATDKDDVTRLQAEIALDYLKAKTKDFLVIDPVNLERRMFGKSI